MNFRFHLFVITFFTFCDVVRLLRFKAGKSSSTFCTFEIEMMCDVLAFFAHIQLNASILSVYHVTNYLRRGKKSCKVIYKREFDLIHHTLSFNWNKLVRH